MAYNSSTEKWLHSDVYTWLRDLCIRAGKSTDYLVNFQGVTGAQLLSFNKSDLLQKDPINGDFFHQQIVASGNMGQYYDQGTSYQSPYLDKDVYTEGNYSLDSCNYNYRDLDTQGIVPSDPSIVGATSLDYYQGGEFGYQQPPPATGGVDDPIADITVDVENRFGLFEINSLEDYELPDGYDEDFLHDTYSENPMPNEVVSAPLHLPTTSGEYQQEPGQMLPPVRCPKPQRRSRVRGPKLYEFLYGLLNDPACNPSIIRWESRSELSFRLVDQNQVAKRWGERRPNATGKALSYDHFARAMRYYYKTGRLVSVPEKKLVCKFGGDVYQKLASLQHASFYT